MALSTMPKPLPIQSLNHVAVVTSRLEASRRFYRDVLGLREVSRRISISPALGFTTMA